MLSSAAYPGARPLRNTIELLAALTGRELRLRYQGSVFGWAWSLARPLALGLTLSFALGKVLGTGITAEFLLAGLFPWTWFQGSVQGATGTFVGNGGLLKKVRFARAVLPLSVVLGQTLQFLLSLPVLAGFLIASGHEPEAAWLALPLVLAVQLVLTMGIGLAVASLTVYLRDLEHIVEVLLNLLFYATPIIYAADRVPDGYRWVTWLNPLAPVIEAWRAVFMDGDWPSADLGLAAVAACAAMAIGWGLFRWLEDGFADAV